MDEIIINSPFLIHGKFNNTLNNSAGLSQFFKGWLLLFQDWGVPPSSSHCLAVLNVKAKWSHCYREPHPSRGTARRLISFFTSRFSCLASEDTSYLDDHDPSTCHTAIIRLLTGWGAITFKNTVPKLDVVCQLCNPSPCMWGSSSKSAWATEQEPKKEKKNEWIEKYKSKGKKNCI